MVNLLGVVLVIGIGGVMILFGSAPLRAYLTVRGTAPTDVAAIDPEMGEVELVGTAQPVEEPLRAPITGKQAIAHSWKVQYEMRNIGEYNDDLRTVAKGKDRQPFILDDGTGKILIDPEGAAMNVDHETWEVGEGENPAVEIRRYLEESDDSHPAASEIVHKRKREFLEGRLSPGSDVYVYGPVTAGPAEDAPSGTVQSYVGSDQLRQKQDDSDGGVSYGLASETDVFTFSNAGEKGTQRTLLTQAALFIGAGAVFVAIGVGVVFL